jgi:hypothetical protein
MVSTATHQSAFLCSSTFIHQQSSPVDTDIQKDEKE